MNHDKGEARSCVSAGFRRSAGWEHGARAPLDSAPHASSLAQGRNSIGIETQTGTGSAPPMAGEKRITRATLSAAKSRASCPELSLMRVSRSRPSASSSNQTSARPPTPAPRRRAGYSSSRAAPTSVRLRRVGALSKGVRVGSRARSSVICVPCGADISGSVVCAPRGLGASGVGGR